MKQIREAIVAEAEKLIRRHELYARGLGDETRRRRRRTTTVVPSLNAYRPRYWQFSPGFDPYLVRARSERIAHSVWSSLGNGSWAPRPPAGYLVPKPDGASREVSVFQVADAAVSRYYFKSLLAKNRAKLSARSYAYRDDLTVHDAIQFIQGEFASRDRLYIAEYDFSSYFESIRQDYILSTLEEHRFLMTDTERHVIEAFLAAPLPQSAGYESAGRLARERGVPQGTSISLLLANLAAAPLDRQLERIGVGFVRYADDTIMWSDDYGRLGAAVDALAEAARLIGADLNLDKSEGVRLLVHPEGPAEIKRAERVEFVGYSLGLGVSEMKERSVDRVKAQLEDLLFSNLLREPLGGTQEPSRLDGHLDKDYWVFLLQARRYLYGDLSEAQLRRYQDRGVPLRRFKGLMSFYPLIDDSDMLSDLDAWFASRAWLSMRKRARLLRSAGYTGLPAPHDLPMNEFVRYRRKSATTGEMADLRLPSFRRIANVVRAGARRHGPNQVGRGGRSYNY